MRISTLACAILTMTSGAAFGQVSLEHLSADQLQAVRDNGLLTREIRRSLDELEKERLQDPGYRASRVAGARLVNERVINLQDNPGSGPEQDRDRQLSEFQALALSARETGQLLDLLAEFDVQEWILGLETISLDRGAITPEVQAAAGEILRRRAELQLGREQGITTLLGAQRYKLWQQYQQHRKNRVPALLPRHSQQTVEVLYRLEELRALLARAGQPLTVAQVLPLAKALMASQQLERLKSGLRDDPDPMEVSSSTFISAAQGRARADRAGILEDAVPLLNPLQVAAVTAELRHTGE